MTKYAVTGASGHLGRLAVESLLAHGIPAGEVVALARTVERTADLAARCVVVRRADYADPDTLGAALAGVDVLLLVSATDVGQRVPQHAAVIDAAKAAGVGRVVYTSALRADDTRLVLAPEHLATEELLRGSGLAFTILRNSWYIENYTDRVDQFLAQGEIVGATGQTAFAGATRADYAEAAVATMVADGHAGAVYELGGTPFDLADLAAAITAASGTQVTYRDVSSAELLDVLQAAGIPEGYAGLLVQLDEATARGELDTRSGDLQRLLGRPSTPLADAVERSLAETAA